MFLIQFLLLSAVLFCIGVYGVLARRNAVLVLMSVELILNAVNINLIAFGAFRQGTTRIATPVEIARGESEPGERVIDGVVEMVDLVTLQSAIPAEVFALFIIAVAAAEVGVGLAMVLTIYRNRKSIDLHKVDLLKG